MKHPAMANKEFLINHRGDAYNIGDFIKNHPGGIDSIKEARSQGMSNPKHSKSAFYLLREYKVGGRDETAIQDNEDLEKYIDWNRPLFKQVANLGPKYNIWVMSPVDRPIWLFNNAILENLTITAWYFVPGIWLPTIAYLIYCADSISIVQIVLNIFIGLVSWTLIEYSSHRWLFHFKPSGSKKILIYIHFVLHGLHHKAPFDTRRLVFPPAPAGILFYAGFNIMKFVFPETDVLLILAGIMFGYVIYDMIHFYLHNGVPMKDTYFYIMKRYHNQHHFAHHDSGFGISSMYWDTMFGTAIRLRKLTSAIKWSRH